jgi:hypothetical protein
LRYQLSEIQSEGVSFPYIAGKNPIVSFKGDLRVAIVGDWGTGEAPAANLLRQVKAKSPDVLVHLETSTTPVHAMKPSGIF